MPVDERYAPPKSAVEDVTPKEPLPQRPPRQIVLAIQFAALSYVVSLTGIGLEWDYYLQTRSITTIVVSLACSVGIQAWLCWKVYRGRNWSRITMLIFKGIGIAGLIVGGLGNLLLSLPPVVIVTSSIGIGLTLAALWLLFLSPGREWFRTRA
jgi:hypothetical protein